MINQILFLFCFIIIGCTNGEKTNFDTDNYYASSIDTLKVINEIKKQYSEINAKASTYDKVEKEVFDETTEGAVLIGYYEKSELKKITGIYYRETGKTSMEYYFNGNDFFFVYSKIFNYEKPIYIDTAAKVKSIEENRYYFYKGDLIKWVSGNAVIPVTSQEFLEQNEFFKQNFEKYKKLFTDYVPEKTMLHYSDTVRCKHGEKCPDTGYILKGSRNAAGRVIHVSPPKNKDIPAEK